MARTKVRQLGLGSASASQCNDKKFVSYRIAFSTLPDKRRRCIVYLKGVSGGERIAVVGDEDGVGSDHYAYKKADGFDLGPKLEVQRRCEVREWLSKLVPKADRILNKKLATRSYSSTEGADTKRVKRAASASAPPAKKARLGA